MNQVYQALYRKWRPRTFDDVVGQTHITDTLKNQVASQRLSHAYLFTGTRGTGKTTCAKILARAVNCENPQGGNPCNQCSACIGIETGTILDVTEMDAASNNGVEHIRDLRDEAIYSPASVKKRVYIVDEVHMLSAAAFNALLKIMEEPPEHLMFILATTELHKVPATILSRCQRFSFKRIRPESITGRLMEIAGKEGLTLTPEGASLLARLSEGALRDALSLLDQCANLNRPIDQQVVLDTLGLAGNLKTAHLMMAIRKRNAADALTLLDQLYTAGKDIKSVLGELTTLTRDLLVQKTAPSTGTALLNGGYDEKTMATLQKGFTAPRLVQILTTLQDVQARLRTTAAPRMDAELCLIQLCDEALDHSGPGLSARLARVEEQLKHGIPVAKANADSDEGFPPEDAPPPDDRDVPPPAEQGSPRSDSAPRATPKKAPDPWPGLAAEARSRLTAPASVYICNPRFVKGVIDGDRLILYVNDESSRRVLNTTQVFSALQAAAQGQLGLTLRVTVQVGLSAAASASRLNAYGLAPDDSLNEVLALGQQFGNMDITY